MTRKLALASFAFLLLGLAGAALADTAEPIVVTPAAEAAPLEPLPWLEATGLSYCEGTCGGAYEIFFKCDTINPDKCCSLLKDSGVCSSFVGFCAGAWDARCRF